MSGKPCKSCQSTEIEYDSASGTSFCAQCGLVFEESNIVSEIGFAEMSSGQAVVQGTLISHDSTKAPGTSVESREKTIAEGRRKVRQLAVALKISEATSETGERFFNLAVTNEFIRGRKSTYVVASCLYAACRMKKDSHMLIDFSDMMQIDVFALGTTYLRLIQKLNLRLEAIDPSIYIQRFASMLEFGNETQRVASDASRLCKRFSDDWMAYGRRPSGICGAALLLAARMNNFRRSVEEIVQVVKIADVTLQKRLHEFSQTGSGRLTVNAFRNTWKEIRHDPPAFVKARQEEAAENKPKIEEIDEVKKLEKQRKREIAQQKRRRRLNDPVQAQFDAYYSVIANIDKNGNDLGENLTPRRLRDRMDDDRSQLFNSDDEEDQLYPYQETLDKHLADDANKDKDKDKNKNKVKDQDKDKSKEEKEKDTDEINNNEIMDVSRKSYNEQDITENIENQEPFENESQRDINQKRNQDEVGNDDKDDEKYDDENNIENGKDNEKYDEKYDDEKNNEDTRGEKIHQNQLNEQDSNQNSRNNEIEINSLTQESNGISDEITGALNDPNLQPLNQALDNVDQKRREELERRNAEIDELKGLDEKEIDSFLLTPEEVKIKERIWVEFNRDYLETIALRQANGTETQRKPKKKKRKAEPSDYRAGSAVEAASEMVKQRKLSKKINYGAIEDLFKKKESKTPEINSITGEEKDDEKDDDDEKYDDDHDHINAAEDYDAQFSDVGDDDYD